jgi:hypothetical protein
MVSAPCFATLAGVAVLATTLLSFQSELVVHKEGSAEYHRPWCAAIRDGKNVLALTRAQAEGRGLKAHTACEKPPSNETTGTAGTGARPPREAPVFVFLDGSKYYHREKCAKSAGPLKRVALDAAGKSLWPCPNCRPPVRRKSEALPLGVR